MDSPITDFTILPVTIQWIPVNCIAIVTMENVFRKCMQLARIYYTARNTILQPIHTQI